MIPERTSAVRLYPIEAASRSQTVRPSLQPRVESRQKSRILVRAMQHLTEPIKERRLAFQNAFSRVAYGKPGSTIHLGNLDHAAGARRPFYLTTIAHQLARVAIALKCPRDDNLAPRLLHRAELEKASFAAKPVSSWNSRFAASRGSSLSAYSPLQMDHAPISFFAQNDRQDAPARPPPPHCVVDT